MSVDLLINPHGAGLILPGNTHTYDRPLCRPIGPERWRIPMTMVIGPEPGAVRDYYEQNLLEPHRRPGTSYGIAFLESQIMSGMMLTTEEAIMLFRAGRANLPGDMPVYGDWLTEGAWEGLIPATTWNPGGVGLVDVYDNTLGGKVTVFEYRIDRAQMFNDRADPSGDVVNMVTFHCDRCHTPDRVGLGERNENNRPVDRAWIAKKARAHARGSLRCEIPDGRMERAVAEAMSKAKGTTVLVPSRASSCATDMLGCGGVREATAVTARLIAEATR